MITGRASGSGTHSYHERSCGINSVHVSHMSEDFGSIRVVFRSGGETKIPVMKLGMADAEMLWAALSAMAKDLKWEDFSELSK